MTHNWIVKLLVIAAIVLLIGAVIRAITPPEIEVPVTPVSILNQDQSRSNFSNIGFSGPTISPPEQVFVAQSNPPTQTKEAFQDRLIKAFDLQLAQYATSTWFGSEYSATYDSYSQAFEVYLSEDANLLPDSQVTTVAAAEPIATQFIQQFMDTAGITALPQRALYFNGNAEPEQTDPSTAAMIVIPYAYTIEGTPILYNYQSAYPIMVYVKGNQVVKAVMTAAIRPPLSITPVPSISVAQAVANINQLQIGSIINARSPRLVPLTLENIVSGDLTSVSFEYRLDEKSGLIYPYYHFQGELLNDEAETIEADLITPAITVNAEDLGQAQ